MLVSMMGSQMYLGVKNLLARNPIVRVVSRQYMISFDLLLATAVRNHQEKYYYRIGDVSYCSYCKMNGSYHALLPRASGTIEAAFVQSYTSQVL